MREDKPNKRYNSKDMINTHTKTDLETKANNGFIIFHFSSFIERHS